MKLSYILFSYFTLFSLGLIDNSRGPIYPEILSRFNITTSLGALVFTISSLSSFITAASNRIWLQKFGVIRSTQFALLVKSISCFIMGFSESYSLFLLGSVTFGVAVGISSISVNLIINNTDTGSHKRQIISGLHSMYGIASLLAPMVLSWLYFYKVNWQSYLVGLGFVPLIFFFIFLREKKQNVYGSDISSMSISKSEFILVASILSLYVLCEILISSRLVLYLKEGRGWDLDEASGQLSLFFLFLLIGRLIFTFKEFKVNSITLLKGSIFSSLIFMLIGIFLYAPILSLCGLTMSFAFPCAVDWITNQYGREGNIIFTRAMTVVGGWLVIMHYLFGVLVSYVSMQNAILVAPLMLISVLYLLQFKAKTLRRIES